MYLFLTIYGALALAFFIFLEVFSMVECQKDNKPFVLPVFQPKHLRMVVCAIFFPIVILIIVIGVITELILDRRK